MPIEYKDTKEFSASQLQRLFLSVNWELGNYPEKLEKAMRNSTHVISAWDRLVGLVRALDDDQTVAFLHYLLVDPEYQGMHIADQMMKQILGFFDELLYIEVIPSDPSIKSFYTRYGFCEYANYSAMVRKQF